MPVPEQTGSSINESLKFRFSFTSTMWIFLPVHMWTLTLLHCILLSAAQNTTNIGSSAPQTSFLDAFRAHYAQFQAVAIQVHLEPTDPFLLELLGEDLHQFAQTATEVLSYHLSLFMV